MSAESVKTLTLTSAPSARRSFYESIVLNLLKDMDQGYLRLSLPSGETLEYGHKDSAVQATIRVNSADFFRKAVLFGDIGFGESFVDGDWDTDNITAVISWFLLNIDKSPAISGSRKVFAPVNFMKWLNRWFHVSRTNTMKTAKRNIADHYDLSNDFFKTFLDLSMTYSSAYFADETMSLENAQTEKYDRLCRLLKLNPSDHVLEIGSGWGGFAVHAAKHYGSRITTITISDQQYAYAKNLFEKEGLSDRIDIRLMDYRKLDGQYDKIVSIEMLEAVGDKYLTTYFEAVQRLLKKDGALAFQVITSPDNRYPQLKKSVDWIQKHIFPGSLLPSISALNTAINSTGGLNMLDLKDMGLHYAKTLSLWRERFNRNIDRVRELGFSDSFIRKWNYYLSYCEAAFAMRNIHVMQMLYVRPNNTRF